MKRLKTYKKSSKNTITKIMVIVFFCVIINTFILFNIYSKKIYNNITLLINEKLDTVIYQFCNELIDNSIINYDTNEILEINKNKNGEIISVNYNLEKTYQILTNVSTIIKKAIHDLEKGNTKVQIDNYYLTQKNNNLIIQVPLFINSKNIFLVNFGPKLPVAINFNESLLTNVKTKVTNYGFNNALLEIYITVEMQKLIITPIVRDKNKFTYDILIGAVVVNGKVPEFYSGEYVKNSGILDIPIKDGL